MAFFAGKYDRQIFVSKKIEAVHIKSLVDGKFNGKQTFYFDTNGFVQRLVYKDLSDKVFQEHMFQFNSHGDYVRMDGTNHLNGSRFNIVHYMTYKDDRLIRDSINGPFYTDYYFDSKGNKIKEVQSFSDSSYKAIIWYTLDSNNRVVKRVKKEYKGIKDTVGILLSDKSIFYNSNEEIIREEEALDLGGNKDTNLGLDVGTIDYEYDQLGNLTEIIRDRGQSQFIKYNNQGLITEVKMVRIPNDNKKGLLTKYTYSLRR